MRLAAIVAQARRESWYENDPGWSEVDAILVSLGQDIGPYLRAKL